MRVLVATQPGSSVFFQLVPLARALHGAGHEVLVATSRRFGPVVSRIGLSYRAAGIDWLEAAVAETFPEVAEHRHDPHGALVRFIVDLFVRRTALPFASDVASWIGQWKPDLLLHSSNELGGAAAAEAAGVPHLMVMAGLDNWFDRIAPALAGTDEARKAVGLAPAHGDAGWLFAHGLLLAEAPGWSTHSLEGLGVSWLRPVSPEQPRGDERWLEELPRPLAHVTLGTVFNKLARPLFVPLASGAARAAASVVVTVGEDADPDAFSGLPANVHVRRYLPLDALLERCDAVLAHGGWGTVVACAEAAVPMAALILGADQGYNAALVERAGFGFGFEPKDCAPDHVAELTRRLLSAPELRAGAARQAAALRAVPSPADVAASLAQRFA